MISVWSYSGLFQSSAKLKCTPKYKCQPLTFNNWTASNRSLSDQVNSLILNWSLTNSVSGDHVKLHIVSSAWLLTPEKIRINAVSSPSHQFPDLGINWGKIVLSSLIYTGSVTSVHYFCQTKGHLSASLTSISTLKPDWMKLVAPLSRCYYLRETNQSRKDLTHLLSEPKTNSWVKLKRLKSASVLASSFLRFKIQWRGYLYCL